MITIKTIQELVGMNISDGYGTNRMIQRVSEDKNKIGEHLYVFHFPAILEGERENGNFEIRLSRTDRTGKGFELFVMGLHGRTVRYLSLYDLKDKGVLLKEMDRVLEAGKTWWVTEANNNYR